MLENHSLLLVNVNENIALAQQGARRRRLQLKKNAKQLILARQRYPASPSNTVFRVFKEVQHSAKPCSVWTVALCLFLTNSEWEEKSYWSHENFFSCKILPQTSVNHPQTCGWCVWPRFIGWYFISTAVPVALCSENLLASLDVKIQSRLSDLCQCSRLTVTRVLNRCLSGSFLYKSL